MEAYAFVETEGGTERYIVDVYKTREEANETMLQYVNKDIADFVRDCGYAPIVKEYDDVDGLHTKLIFCDHETLMLLLAEDKELPEEDYRVVPVTIHF